MTQGFDTQGFDTQGFDKDYWESHWQQSTEHGGLRRIEPNPSLEEEISSLVPGTALDAGCGEGAEAIWLSLAGWQVTAADISREALARAAARSRTVGAEAETVLWIEADLSTWEPDERFDLVTTHYAHPAIPQLAFYERISDWVAPGGTLLIVGHLPAPNGTGHGHSSGHGHSQGEGQHDHGPPEKATATAASITARLDPSRWAVVTAIERVRTLTDRTQADHARAVQLRDVVVRAARRP